MSRAKGPPAPSGWPVRLWVLVRATARAYSEDKIDRMGAALAFYTSVAIAPLLIMAIAFAGLFFRDNSARVRVLRQIEQLVGKEASRALESVHLPENQHAATALAWVSGAVFLLGGLGVFAHLQDALNTIWRAPRHRGETWGATLRRRLFSLGTVVMTGFIMMVSLLVSAALSWFGQNAARWGAAPAIFLEAINFLLSLGVIAGLFAIIFKLLPDVPVRWADVWLGALLTGLLFVGGKTLLGFYLSTTRVASSYGAAGSVIALLLWCYYAGQILFIGAEFTRVHALTEGGRSAPDRA